jgi:polyphosphate:AMP phosphotransferase
LCVPFPGRLTGRPDIAGDEMFEAAELGQRLSKEEYKRRVPGLRTRLLELQQQVRGSTFPVIVVFAGVDGGGKGETLNLLNEWMDPRWIVTRAFGVPSDEERERPEYWRFWRELPPRGRIGLYLNSWYSQPVLDRAHRRIKTAGFEHELARIVQFERTLADDGALICKFWMHLDRKGQRKRLEALERDPLTRWRVTKAHWTHWKMYERFIAAAERVIRTTSTGRAPWMIVEGGDENYRSLTVGEALCEAIGQHLAERGHRSDAAAARPAGAAAGSSSRHARSRAPAGTRGAGRIVGGTANSTILSSLDMSKRLDKRSFSRQLLRYQGELHLLTRRAAERGISAILVFEGWDAAGKGGAIKRVTAALDARQYQVIPIAAPTDEERAHHYLWRFWRHLPRAGRLTIFDRSWYGRVLVERVENLATPAEWMRAYTEINQFEDELGDHGILLVKFWLHITPDEQLRRFKERERSSFKSWKITQEDWRNRENWSAYELAVNAMVERTSTRRAAWTLVEANDKNYARIKVVQTACARLKEVL